MPPIPPTRARLAAALLVVALGAVGCGAAGSSGPGSTSATGTPTTGSGSSAAPSVTPSIPTGGVTLSTLGLQHGPRGFSIPNGAVVTSASDQPQTVTLVLSEPSTADLAAYFSTALPAGGFRITGRATQGQDATIAFTGQGWDGTFTGTGALSGVTLMRQP